MWVQKTNLCYNKKRYIHKNEYHKYFLYIGKIWGSHIGGYDVFCYIML
jgi:hypothetical protein